MMMVVVITHHLRHHHNHQLLSIFCVSKSQTGPLKVLNKKSRDCWRHICLPRTVAPSDCCLL